jgi:hypothetical protein
MVQIALLLKNAKIKIIKIQRGDMPNHRLLTSNRVVVPTLIYKNKVAVGASGCLRFIDCFMGSKLKEFLPMDELPRKLTI